MTQSLEQMLTSEGPNLGATTNEPSLDAIIRFYSTAHLGRGISKEKIDGLVNGYLDGLRASIQPKEPAYAAYKKSVVQKVADYLRSANTTIPDIGPNMAESIKYYFSLQERAETLEHFIMLEVADVVATWNQVTPGTGEYFANGVEYHFGLQRK